MHRVISNTPPGFDTDHQDQDGLNNQEANLRIATKSQNQGNGSFRKNNTSKFRGVSFNRPYRHWAAHIGVGKGRRISLGYFITAEEAARAYDSAAIKYFGEFARLNFPRG